MIVGGEVTKQRITFAVEANKNPALIRGLFAGLYDFFSIPPYNEKVDVIVDGPNVSFSKTNLSDFSYEEFVCIIKKLISFNKITAKTAFELIAAARSEMHNDATYFFPNLGNPYVEVACFYNWLRIDFFSSRFKPLAGKIKKSLSNIFGEKFKVFSNNIDDVSLYNWNDNSILVGRNDLAAVAEVISAYGLLPVIQKAQFVDELARFAIKKYAIYEANELYKKSRSIISEEHSETARAEFEFVAKILAVLGQRGQVGDLEKNQIEFLKSAINNPSVVEKFSTMSLLRDAVKQLVAKLASEIEFRSGAEPREIRHKTEFADVPIIESKQIEAEKLEAKKKRKFF